jgi:hypothetical protein
MINRLVAGFDSTLQVTVSSRRELTYSLTATDDDRPPHVRAASGLTRIDDRWYIMQDDASYVGVVDDGQHAKVYALPLPIAAQARGRRQFSSALGNKAAKPDYEACFRSHWYGSDAMHVVAFGSGSTDQRRSVATLNHRTGAVQIFDATALHEQVQQALGHLPNFEGACLQHELLWLFHRGNTGSSDRGSCAFAWKWLDVQHMLVGAVSAPKIQARYELDLGLIEGVRLGVTDAAVAPHGQIALVCAAEASSNAVDDDVVVGAAIGVIEVDGHNNWTGIRLARLENDLFGASNCKPEGLFIDDSKVQRAYVVADPDNTAVPAVLTEIVLHGPWWRPE